MSRARTVAAALVAAFLGMVVSANVDLSAPPLSGIERTSAVFLLDGQAYFGRLEDQPWSDTVVLRDVYYFEDARKSTTNLAVALAKRGQEVHLPTDVMRIRRDKILAVERVRPGSPLARAVGTQRRLEQLR